MVGNPATRTARSPPVLSASTCDVAVLARRARCPRPAAPSTTRARGLVAGAPSATRTAEMPAQRVPSGAVVTAARPTAASASSGEHRVAVDDGGQHVDGNVALVDPQPCRIRSSAPVSPSRRTHPQADRAPSPRFRDATGTPAGRSQQPIGHRQPGGSHCAVAYQSTIAGTAVGVGRKTKRDSRIRPMRVTARDTAAASRPSTAARCPATPVPRRARRCGSAMCAPAPRSAPAPRRRRRVRSRPPHRFWSAPGSAARSPEHDRSHRSAAASTRPGSR